MGVCERRVRIQTGLRKLESVGKLYLDFIDVKTDHISHCTLLYFNKVVKYTIFLFLIIYTNVE
jgi:hypothetical protein